MRFLIIAFLTLWANNAIALTNVLPYTPPTDQDVLYMRQNAMDLMRTPPRNFNGATNLACIAVTVYHEARGESIKGQRAVADVVIQRALVPNRWGDTPCDVVQPVQFSYLTEDGTYTPIDMVNERIAWERAVRVALTALVMGPDENLKGADHYHTHDVTPEWRLAMNVATVIGEHIFYVDPDSVKKVEEFYATLEQTPRIIGTPVARNTPQTVDLYDWSSDGVPEKTQIVTEANLFEQQRSTAFEPVRAWTTVSRDVPEQQRTQPAQPQQQTIVATRNATPTMGLPSTAAFGFNTTASNGLRLGMNPGSSLPGTN